MPLSWIVVPTNSTYFVILVNHSLTNCSPLSALCLPILITNINNYTCHKTVFTNINSYTSNKTVFTYILLLFTLLTLKSNQQRTIALFGEPWF